MGGVPEIPAEAVEEAARWQWERSRRGDIAAGLRPGGGWEKLWEEAVEAFRDETRSEARNALSAAYPSLRAAVLEEVQERLLGEEVIEAVRREVNNRFAGVWPPPNYQATLFLSVVLRAALQSISEDSP